MEMLGIIVGITGAVILYCALLGIAAVRHIQSLGRTVILKIPALH